MRGVLALGVFCCAVFAQDPPGLSERVDRLEKELAEERAKNERREKRIAELEQALEQATETLAGSQDRRLLEEEIESLLKEGLAADLAPAGDSRLNVGAVLVGSYRASFFSGSKDGTNTFRLEERYLRFVYRFDEQVTARYYTDGSLAELEYHPMDLLQLNVGVVVVPFGQFNSRAFPDTFDTLSRPLLYLGDDDTFVSNENLPDAMFRSIYSDTGIVVSGSRWREDRQLYYAAYLVNGLTGTAELGQASTFSDNNDNKQIGTRISYASSFDGGRRGVGISWMTGKFDAADALSYRMYGVDALLVLDGVFGADGTLTFRAEYVFSPGEILYPMAGDPTLLINDAQREQGAYLIVEGRLDRHWMIYVQGDWMQRKAPLLTGGTLDPANQQDVTTKIMRGSFGVVYKFAIGVVWKIEYAYWSFDLGEPDAHRLSTQLVVPF